MSPARRIVVTLAAFVALLPATASLCWACMPCQAPAFRGAEAAEPDAATGENAASPCHTPASRGPELIADCCCDGTAGRLVAEEAPRLQAPAVSVALAATAAPVVLAPQPRASVPDSSGPPRSGRDRLSLHRVFLI